MFGTNRVRRAAWARLKRTFLASSTIKKVQIRRFDRDSVTGFVNPATFLSPAGVELLSPSGVLSTVPYGDIKTLHFVREFDDESARTERRSFLARPKLDGLWVRMRFRDQDSLEGVLPNNLLQLDSYGFTLIPPDFGSHNQRIFVPRAALIEMQVLGVVGSPLKGSRKKEAKHQIGLFDSDTPTS